MSVPDPRASEVHDFKEILGSAVDGQLPLLVGGHAVNLWSLSFRKHIGREMDQWLPLTSKTPGKAEFPATFQAAISISTPSRP